MASTVRPAQATSPSRLARKLLAQLTEFKEPNGQQRWKFTLSHQPVTVPGLTCIGVPETSMTPLAKVIERMRSA
jgi:hypothetical protein